MQRAFFCTILILLTAGAVFAASPFEYDFAPDSKSLKWACPDPTVTLDYSDVFLKITSCGAFPYIISPPLLCSAVDYDTLIIRMECSKASQAIIFWATDFDPAFNANKSINFEINKPNQPRTYYLNLKNQHPAWAGQIARLAFSPFAGEGSAKISYLKLVKGNLFTNLLAGWQEFWGNDGRTIMGNTINVIFPVKFMGKSIYTYVYWILFLCFVIFALKEIFKSKKVTNTPKKKKNAFNYSNWESIGKKMMAALILLWLMLELSSSYSYQKYFRNDLEKYFGKTPAQKAREVVGPFYDFIVFCNRSLPKEGVEVGLAIPDQMEFFNLYGRYYLFPNRLPEDFRPKDTTPYILVYHLGGRQYLTDPKYSLFAKSNDDEYIVKKK